MSHKPVLLKEIISSLDVQDGEILVDGTIGNAGHTKAILETGVKNLTVIGIDADKNATDESLRQLESFNSSHNIYIETSYFDSLSEILEKQQISKIDKLLLDLGFRSDQIDSAERGLSFLREGPLNMAFTQNPNFTAEDVVNDWEEDNLADIIYGFGEEKFSRRIARAIVEKRGVKRIKTTTELAKIIEQAVPAFYRKRKTHPATKTFQAIRIAVNSELERLQKILPVAFEKLKPGGRIAVISFHSLEDRIVKRFFKEKAGLGEAILINKKPIIATKEEVKENTRARSAKLRTLQKIN